MIKTFILLTMFLNISCGNTKKYTEKPKTAKKNGAEDKVTAEEDDLTKVARSDKSDEQIQKNSGEGIQDSIDSSGQSTSDQTSPSGTVEQTTQAETSKVEQNQTTNETGFNLNNVQWLGENIANWGERANLPNVEFRNGYICLGYDKADEWQVGATGSGTEVVANPWVFIEKDGIWYAATWEWMRPGQHCKAMTSVAGDHIKKYSTFPEDWKPQSGQKLGFMVSTLIRLREEKNDNGQSSRTNIVFTTWP